MHIHILGICGTFMGGVAALAIARGHTVTGCDAGVYPPMSDQLRSLGIELTEGWDVSQLSVNADQYIIGNVVSRGNPLMEAILDAGLPYTSGPAWLAENILHDREVIAVAGTHGKTTTSSLIAHLLEEAGCAPGFLIGGVPENFGVTARLGSGAPFVVEADEYDTAFFDKRAKFVHYRPRVAVLNNLEFDHADIYADLAAIQWQFHQLLRMVPGNGCIVANADDVNVGQVLDAGCWTPVHHFSTRTDNDAALRIAYGDTANTIVWQHGDESGVAPTPLAGDHNLANTAAALLCCNAVGIAPSVAASALNTFMSVKRRMELILCTDDVVVYDDFAHHPTAIALTVAALKQRHPDARLLVAFEPRSNTMKMGIHEHVLGCAFDGADAVFVLRPAGLSWDLDAALSSSSADMHVYDDVDRVFESLRQTALPGDCIVVMSNGGFHGLRERITLELDE